MRILRSISRLLWPATLPADVRHSLLPSDLDLELLEDRRLLSGNVRVIVAGSGDIRILGDGRANHVRIFTNASNQLVISGLADTNGQATLINRGSDPFVMDASVFQAAGKFDIRMGGGNDFVEIEDVTFPGTLRYNPGGGHDSLGLYDVQVVGPTQMTTGGGNDILALVGTVLQGAWDLRTGGGLDFVGLSQSNFTSTARIVMGGGLDGFYVVDSTISGDLTLDMGGWPDAIYLAGDVEFQGRFDGKFGGFWDMLGIEGNVSFQGEVHIDFGPGGFWGNQVFTTEDYGLPSGLVNLQDINRDSDVASDFSDWITEDSNLNLFHLYITAHIDRGFDPADLPIESFGTIDFDYIRDSDFYRFLVP